MFGFIDNIFGMFTCTSRPMNEEPLQFTEVERSDCEQYKQDKQYLCDKDKFSKESLIQAIAKDIQLGTIDKKKQLRAKEMTFLDQTTYHLIAKVYFQNVSSAYKNASLKFDIEQNGTIRNVFFNKKGIQVNKPVFKKNEDELILTIDQINKKI